MSHTIAAIATGNTVSAIGIVRVSGDDAHAIADRLFFPDDGRLLSAHEDRKLICGALRDQRGDTLDQCLATVSHAPHSYTGEDTAELQCHGSPTVLRCALDALIALGARQAGPGEFTRRAFLNGRMDLTRAEAVIDVIDAETPTAAKNAAGQLMGAIARRTDGIYASLADISAHYHAVLDYPDEDIEPFTLAAYRDTLSAAMGELSAQLATFDRGRVLRAGVPAAIIGRPNAGKSSLLNALLGYDRAIVTDIPGTTRDTLEEKVCLGGVLLRLTDTAGLRRADGEVERLGVSRALAVAREAQLVIAVFDGSAPLSAEDEETLAVARRAALAVAVVNKSDLPRRLDAAQLPDCFARVIPLSARTGEGLALLERAAAELFPLPSAPAGEILTNARQADAVGAALASLTAAREAMEQGVTPDAVLTETEQAMSALAELSGRRVRDDVTDRIFARFCVGK